MQKYKLFLLSDYFKLEPEEIEAIQKYGEKRFIKELVKDGIVRGMILCEGWKKVQEITKEFISQSFCFGRELLLSYSFNIDDYIGILIKEKHFELKEFNEDWFKYADDKTYLWIDKDLFEYDEKRLKKKLKKVCIEVLLKDIAKLLERLREYEGGDEE